MDLTVRRRRTERVRVESHREGVMGRKKEDVGVGEFKRTKRIRLLEIKRGQYGLGILTGNQREETER